MIVFKFKIEKKDRIKGTFIVIIITITSMLVFTNLDIGIRKSFLYLISAIFAFLFSRYIINKTKNMVEDLHIEGENFKFYFFNKMVNNISLTKGTFEIEIENSKIIVFNNKRVKAVLYKDGMEEPERWNDLIQILGSKN